MRFTQFMFPNGGRVPERIARPDNIEALAKELAEAGWSFEIECDPATGLVHADCCDDDEVLDNGLCVNGPKVPPMIDAMVTEAHRIFVERGRPKAKGSRATALERDFA